MSKKIIVAAVVLMAFLPVSADKSGRIQELEAEVEILRDRVEMLEVETACIESYVNFVLSEAFVDMIRDQL